MIAGIGTSMKHHTTTNDMEKRCMLEDFLAVERMYYYHSSGSPGLRKTPVEVTTDQCFDLVVIQEDLVRSITQVGSLSACSSRQCLVFISSVLVQWCGLWV